MSYDHLLLSSIVPSALNLLWRRLSSRLNQFDRFEQLATSKSSANRHFLRFEDKTYTYAEAYDLALRYAAWLKSRYNVKKGEIVALDFQNTDTFAILILALWSLGAAPALINYNLTGPALLHCVKRATTRLMFIDPTVAENFSEDVRNALETVQFEVLSPELEAQARETEPFRAPDEIRADAKPMDMAALIYTSGTTGLPKAAIVSWAKVWIVGGFTHRWIGTKPSDVYYTVRQPPSLPLRTGQFLVPIAATVTSRPPYLYASMCCTIVDGLETY